MRYRLRTLMIALAFGLVLLGVGMRLIPEKVNLPGGMLTWYVLMHVYHFVIPYGLILTLATAGLLHFWPDNKTGRENSN